MPVIKDENGKYVQLTPEEYNQQISVMRRRLNLDAEGKWVGDVVPDLDVVKINGEEFTGIGYEGLLSVNTKTYVTEPTRAGDGAIKNINDYETFYVPRVKINFKYFSIQDYRRFCNAIMSNEFIVEYYDKQFGKRVSHKMYAEPEEMYAIFNVSTTVIGIFDYEVSLIGTLNDLESYSVIYDKNGGTILNYKGHYSSNTTYSYKDRVEYQGKIYEAIYQNTSFSGVAPGDVSYWSIITVSAWNNLSTYYNGNVVYVSGADGEKNYYKAIFSNSFSGVAVTNTDYWVSISVAEYNADKTYYLGDVTISNSVYYRAIYDNSNFSNKPPSTETSYWLESKELNPQSFNWGNSFVAADVSNLFISPSGKTFKGYNTNKDSTTTNNQGIWYYPNQSISVFSDLTLYAIWE